MKRFLKAVLYSFAEPALMAFSLIAVFLVLVWGFSGFGLAFLIEGYKHDRTWEIVLGWACMTFNAGYVIYAIVKGVSEEYERLG